MSRAVAEACTAFATVMTDNLEEPPDDGIWNKVEFPALQQGSIYGKVNSIDAISPGGKKIKSPFWTRVKARGELQDEEEAEEDYESDDQEIDLIPRDPANKPSALKSAPKSGDAKPAGSKSATTKPGAKPNTKSNTKPDTKPDNKPDTKPGAKPDTKPDTKPGAKPDTKSDTQPRPATPGSSSCGIGKLGLEAAFEAGGQYAVEW